MNEDFEAILSHVIEKTGHERYRWLTSEANPDEKARTGYRRLVVERYQQLLSEPEYPPLFEQAKGALGAMGRVVAAAIKRQPVRVPAAEVERRLALCQACEHFDPVPQRCRQCGCGRLKLELATERCPLVPPKWDRVPPASEGA